MTLPPIVHYPHDDDVGLGGGQLGRMLAASASLLNIPVVILDVGAEAPAKQILAPTTPDLAHIDGSFRDPAKIRELAAKVDVLTVEIEHIDVDVLEEVEVEVPVHPAPSTIRTIQDKFRQKVHLQCHALPIAPFFDLAEEEPTTIHGIKEAAARLGLPLMLKSKTLAYDGRGNFVLRDLSHVQDALEFLSGRPLYAEKWVPFVKEIAVMVVRTAGGQTRSYPVVETVHKDNICHLVFAPLRSRDPQLAVRAQEIAERAVKSLSGAGVFGVEMFLLADGVFKSLQTCTFILKESTLTALPNRRQRPNFRERDRASTSQLGPLHHRSVRDLTIRKSSPRHPLPPHRLDRAQSALRRHAQPPRLVERHVRARRLCRVCARRAGCERAPLRQGGVPQRSQDGTHNLDGELGRRDQRSSPPAAASPSRRS